MSTYYVHGGSWFCVWCCLVCDTLHLKRQVIAEQLASLQQDATVKQRLRKIGDTLLSHRQLSQQEAAFLMAGLHLKGSSRATVFVAAISKHQQTELVRPSHQL